MTQLDIPTLNLVLGVAIPLLVGLVTKLRASSGTKAVMNAGLSAVAGGLGAALAASGRVDLKTVLLGVLTTWGTSILTYYGLWKPTGVSSNLQEVTANIGVGGASVENAKPEREAAMVHLDVAPDPPFGELADSEDELDGCDIDMAAHAIPEGEEWLYALSPTGDRARVEEYRQLFNGPNAPETQWVAPN